MVQILGAGHAFIFVIFLEKSYWAPKRLGGLLLGIEDILISFILGAMAWLMAAWPHQDRLGRDQNPGSPWRRYPLYSLPVAGVYLLLVWARMGPMTSLIVTLLVAWGVFLILRPDLWSLSLTGGLLFPLGYYPCVRLIYWIWPDSVNQWNLNMFWGNLIGGVPVGELVWAVMFGACWPLLVGCVYQVRVLKEAPVSPIDRRLAAEVNWPDDWLREKRSGKGFRE